MCVINLSSVHVLSHGTLTEHAYGPDFSFMFHQWAAGYITSHPQSVLVFFRGLVWLLCLFVLLFF